MLQLRVRGGGTSRTRSEVLSPMTAPCDTAWLRFSSRLGFRLPAREPGSRLPGCLLKPPDHPANVLEQLTALLPDGFGISLQLAHAHLRLLPQHLHLPP